MPLENILYAIVYFGWFGFVLYKTHTAVMILPLLFPLYLLRIEFFDTPIYFIEGLILIAALPVFISILIGKETINKSFFSKFVDMLRSRLTRKKSAFLDFIKSPFLPITIFMFAAIVSAIIVPDEGYLRALGILKSWIIIPLVFFVIYYYCAKSLKNVSVAMRAYLASALLLCFWAVYQAISGNYLTIDQRVSGPFESANYLALYITPALVFAYVRLIQTFLHKKVETAGYRWRINEKKIIYAIVSIFLFAVLILTQSYGGIIGFFVAALVYLIIEKIKANIVINKRFLNKLIGFIVVFVVIAISLTAILNIEKFKNLFEFEQHTSLATRIEIWHVGGELIKENPIVGTGLGQFEDIYIERAEELLGREPLEQKRLHSHNIFIEFWLNSGLLGLVSFIWIVVLAYCSLRKSSSPEIEKLKLAMVAMLTYIIVHGIIDVPFWKNDLALVFWLIIGTIFALSKIEEKQL